MNDDSKLQVLPRHLLRRWLHFSKVLIAQQGSGASSEEGSDCQGFRNPCHGGSIRCAHAMLGRMRLRTSTSFFLLALTVFPLNARVLHVDVVTRATVLNGKEFGAAGAYERITGRVSFSLSAANTHNQRIVDLDNAVNLKGGEVEFSADFVAVRPKNVDRGNGSMLLEVPNRGNAVILGRVDGGDEDLAHDAGDAWLLRNGYTIVSLGWQWDAQGEGALRFFAPVAKENGKTITGLLRGDFMLSKAMPEIPLDHFTDGHIGGIEYPEFRISGYRGNPVY